MNNTKRNVMLDVLKGISIIAIFLYHFGGNYTPYGYLGVETFFVISGYFMMVEILKLIDNHSFSYGKYMTKKIYRLWPPVIIVISIAFLVGYNAMLPDDFENLSSSVVSSSLFMNNILECITTKNYWDIANVFKPLMHLWYVGILMQAYIVLSLVYFLIYRSNKEKAKKRIKYTLIILTAISFICYLCPVFSDAHKFYLLPFRIFEITCGSLIAFANHKKYEHSNKNRILNYILLAILLILDFTKISFIAPVIKLISMVAVTSVLVYRYINIDSSGENIFARIIASVGRASFSIYLTHQVIIAFMFYAITDSHNPVNLILCAIVTAIVSFIMYNFVEKSLSKYKKKKKYILLVSTVICFVLIFTGFVQYKNAGVVRDVPELGIEKNVSHRGMHAEYCDRPYNWNNDFCDDGKKNILILGNSFGRDWANILHESEYRDNIEISYLYSPNEDELKKYSNRILSADMVFVALGTGYDDIPEYYNDYITYEKLYIVGNKNFGSSNGIIYSKRNKENYFDQYIEIPGELIVSNNKFKDKYKSHFIDLIGPLTKENKIKVFTDDNKYISQDCRHLTKYGAKFYSKILNLSEILQLD